MKILILTPFYYGIGGAETFTQGLVEQLKKEHEVDICTIDVKGVWQGVGLRNFIIVFPRLLIECLKNIKRKRYDVIHAQGIISALASAIIKQFTKRKIFLTLLALYDFKDWKGIKLNIVKWIFNNCDLIFVEGKNGEKDIETISKKERRRIFFHWVNQEKFKPPQERDNEHIKILFVGRPIKEKGMHIIKEAEKILNDSKYEFIYIQDVSNDLLPSYYQMAHICVVPSLYSEGYCRVVAEAASCGCAVIASNRGSLLEMVGPFGWAIVPKPEQFAEAIQLVARNLHRWSKMSYDYAKLNFSVKNAEVFLGEYR